MDILIIIIFIVIASVLIGLLMVIISTIRRKGKWGINFKRFNCPKCGTQAPIIRKTKSIREALWGGWTCQKCGCKLDKWGVEIR